MHISSSSTKPDPTFPGQRIRISSVWVFGIFVAFTGRPSEERRTVAKRSLNMTTNFESSDYGEIIIPIILSAHTDCPDKEFEILNYLDISTKGHQAVRGLPGEQYGLLEIRRAELNDAE